METSAENQITSGTWEAEAPYSTPTYQDTNMIQATSC
jgi:hypothetical protein